jgi:hypothetical protein
VSYGNEYKENTTTTRRDIDAQRDAPGTAELVRDQGRRRPDVLLARLKEAGIDPATGFPMAAPDAEPATPAGEPATAGQGTAYRPAGVMTADDTCRSPQDAPGAPQGTGTDVQAVSSHQAAGGGSAAQAMTPPPAGSPSSSRARQRSGLSHAADVLPGGLDDAAERETGSPASGSDDGDGPAELLSDADIEQRRQQGLRAIAAWSTTTTESVTLSVTPTNC